jgi:hypothetical protein
MARCSRLWRHDYGRRFLALAALPDVPKREAGCGVNADRSFLNLHEGDEGVKLCTWASFQIPGHAQANLFEGSCLDRDKPKATSRPRMHVVKGANVPRRCSHFLDMSILKSEQYWPRCPEADMKECLITALSSAIIGD